MPIRHLVLVLGDQLDISSTAFESFDKQTDLIWMAEVPNEAGHVWATKQHIAIFLSAMRHFRDQLQAEGFRVDYRNMDDPDNRGTLGAEPRRAAEARRPSKAVVVKPGEWRGG